MGDRLRAGKLSRHVTSHPGQLSLAIPPWVGAMSTSLSWEGNRKSGFAVRTGHASQTVVVYPPTGSTAYEREMSTPATLFLEYGPPLPLPAPCSSPETSRIRECNELSSEPPPVRLLALACSTVSFPDVFSRLQSCNDYNTCAMRIDFPRIFDHDVWD